MTKDTHTEQLREAFLKDIWRADEIYIENGVVHAYTRGPRNGSDQTNINLSRDLDRLIEAHITQAVKDELKAITEAPAGTNCCITHHKLVERMAQLSDSTRRAA